MDTMSSFDIRLVVTLPPSDSTLQYKRCVHLLNNFPCIKSLCLVIRFCFSSKFVIISESPDQISHLIDAMVAKSGKEMDCFPEIYFSVETMVVFYIYSFNFMVVFTTI